MNFHANLKHAYLLGRRSWDSLWRFLLSGWKIRASLENFLVWSGNNSPRDQFFGALNPLLTLSPEWSGPMPPAVPF
jgi:hypothetical protein